MLLIVASQDDIQKQPFADVLQIGILKNFAVQENCDKTTLLKRDPNSGFFL